MTEALGFFSFVRSFIRSFVHSFIHSFILSFILSFIHSFIHPFAHPSIHPSIHPFIHSFFRYRFCLVPPLRLPTCQQDVRAHFGVVCVEPLFQRCRARADGKALAGARGLFVSVGDFISGLAFDGCAGKARQGKGKERKGKERKGKERKRSIERSIKRSIDQPHPPRALHSPHFGTSGSKRIVWM